MGSATAARLWQQQVFRTTIKHGQLRLTRRLTWRRTVTDETWLTWVERAKIGAAALVAVGVVLEFVGEFAGRPAERRVRAAADAQMAKLQNETAQAKLELARLTTPRTLG